MIIQKFLQVSNKKQKPSASNSDQCVPNFDRSLVQIIQVYIFLLFFFSLTFFSSKFLQKPLKYYCQCI